MSSRYPFPGAPNGWFGVSASDQLAPGEVRALAYLGRDLVLFRGEDGVARVFDAHCPHLGAHLGVGGQVCGEGISCPFHGWTFDGDGYLSQVPGLDQPPRVAAKAWIVCERNGRIFVWHHADGGHPDYDVIGYRLEQSSWTPWRCNTYQVRAHVQDLTENIIDRSHFLKVHDMAPPESDHFEVRFDGTSMIVEQSLKVTAMDVVGYEIETTTTTCGPGIVAVEVHQDPIDMLTYITQTPIDEELTEVNLSFSMKALSDENATESISELNDRITNEQFTQDVPIWENKIYRERPIITKIDGPVREYRRWFQQFYSNPI
jgi:3-ketosteroid 9alpha-monooxygenase subunit A